MRDSTKAWISLVAAALIVVAMLSLPFLLLSCGGPSNRPASELPVEAPKAAPHASPTTAAEAETLLKAKDQRIFEMERELQAERADRGLVADERDRLAEAEEIKSIKRNANYASWLAGFGFFASVVAYFMLTGYAPWIGKLCIGGAAGALAVLVLARMVSWLAPYLLIVGCALTGIGVLVLVVYLRKGQKTTTKVVELYEESKDAIDKVIGKEARVRKQVAKLGTKNKFIETLRTKAGLT